MLIKFCNAFTKITAWPVQKLCFRTKIHYEDKSVMGRHIKGPAIIISNHTSVFDYAVFLFVFFDRTLRYQMAEVLFKKQPLGTFLRMLGGILVDRDAYNFAFIAKSEEILKSGGIVGIFPEGRLPRQDEKPPLPFKPSAAYIALSSGVPVIPVYTNGSYFCKKRAHVMIGTPLLASDLTDPSLGEKENLELVSARIRDKIVDLENKLNAEIGEEKKTVFARIHSL